MFYLMPINTTAASCANFTPPARDSLLEMAQLFADAELTAILDGETIMGVNPAGVEFVVVEIPDALPVAP